MKRNLILSMLLDLFLVAIIGCGIYLLFVVLRCAG